MFTLHRSNIQQVMHSTIHTNPIQPIQWSPFMGMLVRVAEIRHSLDSGTGIPKLGSEKNPFTQEAGR